MIPKSSTSEGLHVCNWTSVCHRFGVNTPVFGTGSKLEMNYHNHNVIKSGKHCRFAIMTRHSNKNKCRIIADDMITSCIKALQHGRYEDNFKISTVPQSIKMHRYNNPLKYIFFSFCLLDSRKTQWYCWTHISCYMHHNIGGMYHNVSNMIYPNCELIAFGLKAEPELVSDGLVTGNT